MRVPFFGMLADKSPLDGLLEHYEKINGCVALIKESMECYVAGGACREFMELAEQIDEIENQADLIKRRIRNHLPRGLFMPVDKALFLNYTKAQDNVLDEAQEAMQWLAMRRVDIPADFQLAIIELIEEVKTITDMLGPALSATLGLIYTKHLDRRGTKDQFWAIRRKRSAIFKMKNRLVSRIYNAEMDFKDIYQLIHFVEKLHGMAHNTENCADILRSMIAR
ncbi:DUF47 domain-containing protein [Desulfocurvus vexinensis]|uniref:DUF47 domain-containing protein n=1 Tax=Desulfocurvus vexinensis TaxID=399548 RepID=UPI00048AA47D|nr:DUF47 family protein [Desulfocurvus vexinensis]